MGESKEIQRKQEEGTEVDAGRIDSDASAHKSRPDGVAFIDDAATEPCEDESTIAGEEVDDDGSSMEEDSDDGGEGGWPIDEHDFLPPIVPGDEDEDEEDLDWGVENEDWELADGGG